ncbi:hypothetical protein C0J56_00460 [Pseudomonas fluorescens]|nr:hypothetical protein C0J56_00460 [Pseudomonas fluorescens]
MPLQTTVLLIKSLISRPPHFYRHRLVNADSLMTIATNPSALSTTENDRCGAKVALENTKAGQFPDHQLQARFITMIKEHLGGNTQRH